MESLPEPVVEPQLKGVFGFEISIDKVEAADKLSQNRNDRDHANIISELEETRSSKPRYSRSHAQETKGKLA